jgi:hypothetical protein
MEQKRFGVRISLIKELRLFQLSLQNNRKNMPFTCMASVSLGGPEGPGGLGRMRQVIADVQTISVTPINPPMNGIRVPRQVPVVFSNSGLFIKLDQDVYVTIRFRTNEERAQLLGALGNLEDLFSSSEEEANNEVNGENEI